MDRISDDTIQDLLDDIELLYRAESTPDSMTLAIQSALTELRERRKADKVDEPVLIDCDYCKRRHDQRIACHAYLQSGHGA